jgi:hypothetical protein
MTLKLISLLSIYLLGSPDGLAFALALGILIVARDQRLQVLGFVNVLFLLFSVAGPRQRITGEDLLADASVSLAEHPSILILKIAALSCLACLMWLGVRLLRAKKLSGPLLFNLVLLFVLLAIYGTIHDIENIGPLMRGTAVYFAHFFWFICYSQIALAANPRRNFLSTFAAFPFWNSLTTWHIGAIPRGTGELIACDIGENKNSPKYDLISSAMVVGGVLVISNFEVFKRSLFVLCGLPSVTLVGLHRFDGLGVSTLNQWIISALETSTFLVQNTGVLCVFIGIVRLAGFNIPFAIQYPWRADSYGDFLRRLYYYYSETIMYFFLPIFRRVSRRPTVSIALSVLVGGFLAHFIEEIPYGLDPSASYALRSLRIIPYLSLILAGLWATRNLRVPKGAGIILRSAYTVFFFMLYSMAYNSLIFFKENYIAYESPATLEKYFSFMGNFLGL